MKSDSVDGQDSLRVIHRIGNSQTTCNPHQKEIKSLDELRSNQQYHEMFQEMMRVNHESGERPDEEDLRLRRIMGEDNFEVLKGGVSRRRASGQFHSAAGRRRARSQALRREKLNSQSLRSHLTHIRRAQEDSRDDA